MLSQSAISDTSLFYFLCIYAVNSDLALLELGCRREDSDAAMGSNALFEFI